MNHRLGITFMTLTALVFAFQDGISKHLAVEYNSMMVVMLRFWFFGMFVVALSSNREGGIRAVAKTSQPWLQTRARRAACHRDFHHDLGNRPDRAGREPCAVRLPSPYRGGTLGSAAGRTASDGDAGLRSLLASAAC